MTPLHMAGLSKRYGAQPVLDQVDLAVNGGELVALLGPSGCGKSTLLRLVAGLVTPDAGSITLGGQDMLALPPERRGVAMVFQNYALYPQMTAAENIALPLRARRMTRLQRLAQPLLPGARRSAAAIAAEVAAIAEALDIAPLLHRRPAQLSGGQRQRVALARALVRQSQVLLLDEPLSSLDARLRLQAREEIVQIQRRFAITTLFVTHDQAEAMAIADRVAVMLGGRIAQYGTPGEIYHDPASLAVAGFIGHEPINRFAVQADSQGRLHLEGHPLGIAVARPEAGLTLGVRAEGLAMAAAGLPARALRVEDHGATAFLHASHAQGHALLRLPPGPRPSPGEALHLAPLPGAALVFGADGQRLPLREAAFA